MGVGFNYSDEITINGREFKELIEQSERCRVATNLLKKGYISREDLYLILTGESLPEENNETGTEKTC